MTGPGLLLRQRGLQASQGPGSIAAQILGFRSAPYSSTGSSSTTPQGPDDAAATPSAASRPVAQPGNDSTATSAAAASSAASTSAPPLQQRPAQAQLTPPSAAGLARAAAAANPNSPPAAGTTAPGYPSTAAARPAAAPTSAPAPAGPATIPALQALSPQLGEPGNPIQSIAALSYPDPRSLRDYGRVPSESDARFMAILGRNAPARQERAAAVANMAAGRVPPPAVLVWASCELVSSVRGVVQEQLQQQQRTGASSLQDQPWYEAALQLARALYQQHQPSAPSPAPTTELALLRWLAQGTDGISPGISASSAPAPSSYVPWESLAALPAFPALLHAATCRSSSLEATLRLTGLTAVAAAEDSPASSAAGTTPGAASGTGRGTAAKAGAQVAKGGKEGSAALAVGLAGGLGERAPGLLAQLRQAAAAARRRALAAVGGAVAADPPLDADEALTALAVGGGRVGSLPAGFVSAASAAGVDVVAAAGSGAVRAAAAEWLAAARLVQRVEERLGCCSPPAAARGGGVQGQAWRLPQTTALMRLLGVPLEPPQLDGIPELQVDAAAVQGWVSTVAKQVSAAPAPGAASTHANTLEALVLPSDLDARLRAARQQLAASGRALILSTDLIHTHTSTTTTGTTNTTSTTSTGTGGGANGVAEATAAWLRTVGTPLCTGLLDGGYSFRQLRSLAPELKEALLLRLLDGGRPGGGAAAVAAAWYGGAAAAWEAARADVEGAAEAVAQLRREQVEAELDYVRERFVPSGAASLPAAPPLPSTADLAAAVAALPKDVRQLYDNYYALHPAADASVTAAAAAAGTAAAGGSGAVRVARALGEGAAQGVGTDGKELQAWLSGAKKRLLEQLPDPLLGLLLGFLRVQVSVTPEHAQAQRNKLLLLASLVAEQQQRAAGNAAAAGGGGGGGAPAAGQDQEAAAREVSRWWATIAGPAPAAEAQGGVGSSGHALPGALQGLLGSQGARDFASWLQAMALTTRDRDEQLTSLQLLAQEGVAADVDRYVQMSMDPRLSLPSLERPGRPTTPEWADPQLRQGAEAAVWLEGGVREQLDAYLEATGHRPLGDAEWTVYRDAALEEWEAGRAAREAEAAEAGASGFFNPRAEEVFLQRLLESGVAPGDPLGPQSRRYLDTIVRNPSWTFVQRHQAVQRLIELNAHFLRQPPAPAGGSPFAPLFAPGGPDVVPKLAMAGAAGGEGRPALPPPELPQGF